MDFCMAFLLLLGVPPCSHVTVWASPGPCAIVSAICYLVMLQEVTAWCRSVTEQSSGLGRRRVLAGAGR